MTPATSSSTGSCRSNELLGAFSDDAHRPMAPHMVSIVMKSGEMLYAAGKTQPWVYFPCDAVVSLLYQTGNGDSTEIAIVGNEGMLGISMLLSGGAAIDYALVQSGGTALRVHANVIREEFARNDEVRHVLLRYTQALMAQMGQTAVCNRCHTVDRRLCRWLLASLDRRSSNEVIMTQGMIADMLGVRREGVAVAAKALQRAGAIEYKHGHVEVIDRARLELLACECYEVMRAGFARLLPWSSFVRSGGGRTATDRVPAARAGEARRYDHTAGCK